MFKTGPDDSHRNLPPVQVGFFHLLKVQDELVQVLVLVLEPEGAGWTKPPDGIAAWVALTPQCVV